MSACMCMCINDCMNLYKYVCVCLCHYKNECKSHICVWLHECKYLHVCMLVDLCVRMCMCNPNLDTKSLVCACKLLW